MKNHTKVLAGLGFGAVATLALATGILKPTVKLTALATLISVPVIGIANEVIQSRADKKVKGLEDKLGIAQQDSRKLASATADNERLSQHLASLKTELSQLQSAVVTLKNENHTLQETNKLIYRLSEELKSENQELSEQIAHYEETYSSELETEVQERVEEYISGDRAKLDAKYRSTIKEGQAIHAEAVAIAKAYEQWATQVAERHSDRRDYILGLTKEFNHHIEGAEETWKTERGHLITQIEILTEKVARLQQRLAGDYTEPLFLDCRFAIPGQIANELAKIIWKGFSIPLAAKGAQQRSEGLIEIGYAYSQSQAPGELVELLNRHSNSLAKELGVHKITSVREHDLTPSIIVGLRREPEVKEDTVKRLLTPIDKLATQVLRGMAQKPTLRVMGSTGAGKGICVKYLLSIMSEYMECYIRLHDPQHGSSEDHWDIPKVSKSGAETKKALSKISQQLRDREVTKINQPITVDILDEIDTQLEKSDKEQFLDLISRIRHLGMKLILIGQNPKVNRAGFQWSDMGQMIAFYQKESALDAIKNYPALKLKEDILTKQYYQLSEAYELKNKDLDTHKQYYFGLCVIPGKTPVWYELPVADSIAINDKMTVIGETFEVTVSNQEFVEGQNSAKIEPSVMAVDEKGTESAEAETLTQKRFAANSAKPSVIPHVGGSAKSRHTAKTICKKHPSVELRQRKDGRYYCPGCKKKLRKDELTVEV
ncbi:MAG: hypothetical protein F6K21_07755 [Symploca sp. SIO2D2]|nr:hypothetical protein [Symploca sp. SIO2D2]